MEGCALNTVAKNQLNFALNELKTGIPYLSGKGLPVAHAAPRTGIAGSNYRALQHNLSLYRLVTQAVSFWVAEASGE